MKPSARILVVSALVLVVAAGAWLGWTGGPRQAVLDVQDLVDGISVREDTPTSTSDGEMVPDVELATLPPYREAWGDPLRLHDHVGDGPLVVNVWASWCPPCRREAPLLEAAWREHGERVQFLGVNLRDQESAAVAFIEEFGLTFPSGADPRGEVANQLGVVGVPTTFFIDETGRIRTTKVGEIDERDLERRIQALSTGSEPEPAPDLEPKRSVESP